VADDDVGEDLEPFERLEEGHLHPKGVIIIIIIIIIIIFSNIIIIIFTCTRKVMGCASWVSHISSVASVRIFSRIDQPDSLMNISSTACPQPP
jgi:hypothetical protein